MALDERARHRLYNRLAEVLGPDEAVTLMEHLPPTGWGDVARKDDIARLETATKSDIARLEATTKNEIARLENDIARLEASMNDDLLQLEARLGHKMEAEVARLRGDILDRMATQAATFSRSLVVGNSVAILTVAGLAFAAARFA